MRVFVVASKATDAVTFGFLPAAARLGLEVVLLTDRPDAQVAAIGAGVAGGAVTAGGAGAAGGTGLAEVVGCDVFDVRALIPAIARVGRPDAVFSNSDHLQVQTALAAEYFGRPGKDWRSCLRAKDKVLMRVRLAETGAEKVAAAEIGPEAFDAGAAGLPYPVVLKPAEGVASEDVWLVADPAELAARTADVLARRPGERLIAEEYLPGTLRTLETIGDGRRTWVLGGFRTTVSAAPHFVEERLTWDPLPDGDELAHVRRALDDLGSSFGACHSEFICDSSAGARLVEVNDRLIGDHCEFLMTELLGEDLFERVLRVYLGEPLPADPPSAGSRHAVADYLVAERSGLLAAAPPAGSLTGAEPGVSLRYWPLRAPGERIALAGSNRDYLGVITATGPDRAAVERSVAAARGTCRWELTP